MGFLLFCSHFDFVDQFKYSVQLPHDLLGDLFVIVAFQLPSQTQHSITTLTSDFLAIEVRRTLEPIIGLPHEEMEARVRVASTRIYRHCFPSVNSVLPV